MKRILTTLALATLLLAIPAAADGPAQLDKAGTSLNWNLDGNVHSLHLVITGPDGERFEKTFPGGNVSLDLAKLVDGKLADGRYTWEVRENPAPRTRGVDLPTKQAMRSASGAFSIEGGAIVPDAIERLPTKDIVHNDDVIITFSLCVGNDCVNGESFGFDTIRLKENNLRIHFDDTSSTSSFPRNDWRIVANDTTNGGASYLAIEDSTAGRIPFRVEAGARNNALVVDSTNRIGVGTISPSVLVHTVDGNTPTLRLEQDGSSGFTPRTWDIAGNEANFFVRDVTGGSLLPFRIRPGAPTSSIDIAASGNVGVGTASPDYDLEVENNGASAIALSNTSTTNGPTAKWFIQADDDANRVLNVSKEGTGGVEFQVNNRLDGSGVATLIVNGSVQATNVTFSSSRELKDDFASVDPQQVLSQVAGLPILQWRYKTEPTGIRHMGPVAEEFAETFKLGKDTAHITMSDLDGVALAAIQGLLQQVNELREQNVQLQERLEKIEQSVE